MINCQQVYDKNIYIFLHNAAEYTTKKSEKK